MAPAVMRHHATDVCYGVRVAEFGSADEVILALIGGNGFGVLWKFGVVVAHMRRNARDEKCFRVVGVVRQIGVIVQTIYIMKNSSVKFDRRCIFLVCIFLIIVSARARE